MDIGALDSFERLREGSIEWVFLTEDANTELLSKLAVASGFDKSDFVIFSYRTSTNIQAAFSLSEFILEIAPNTSIVIHRDSDFMTSDEKKWISDQIEGAGAIPFFTEGPDIESYFLEPSHLAEILSVEIDEVVDWQNEIAESFHNELMHRFSRKRDDLKYLYKKKDEQPPETLKLLGSDHPLPPEKRVGKIMLKRLRGSMHKYFGKTVDITTATDDLFSHALNSLVEDKDA